MTKAHFFFFSFVYFSVLLSQHIPIYVFVSLDVLKYVYRCLVSLSRSSP